jgi:3D (Asp-Asp-Asp) domain-containing protein
MKRYKYDPQTLSYIEIDNKKLILFLVISFLWLSSILTWFILSRKHITKTTQHIVVNNSRVSNDTLQPDTLRHKVHVTFYNATSSQCDGIPNVTASGFKINMDSPYKHRIIAISPDLIKKGFKLGDIVTIKFPKKHSLSIYNGQWRIEDKTSSRHTNLVDLLVNVGFPMGSVKGVEIIKVN